MSNANHMNTAREDFNLPDKQNSVDELLKSTYLWTALRRLHENLNARSRYNSLAPLPAETIHLANTILNEVHDFVGDFRESRNIPTFDEAAPPSYIDALVAVGKYKGLLRAYMIEMLGKNPYSLT